MRMWRPIFTMFALFSSPAVSVAGPIDFNLVITSESTPGVPSPGPLDIAVNQQGNLQLMPGGSMSLGTVHYGSMMSPQAAASYTTDTQFSVFVKVTDTASGESDTLKVYGAAVDWWDLREWDGRWSNSYHNLEIGDHWTNTPLIVDTVLGGRDYILTVTTDRAGSVADFVLSVDGAPGQVATTPEPASFLLGAIALLPIGAGALRRRLGRPLNEVAS
jgi:hypothetical protein